MQLTPDLKIAGILAPLFALRREHDLGVGDVTALRELVDWAAELGFRVVQLLPVNETGSDNSPYNAISSAAIEPATIDCARLPQLEESEARELISGVDLARLRSGPVAYPLVKSLKRALLRRSFENFSALSAAGENARAQEFKRFTTAHAAWLEPYAFFRALMEHNGGSERWDAWPEEQQSLAAAACWLEGVPEVEQERIEEEIRFIKYVQWIAWAQWREVSAHAASRGVALMGDVPFGVSYYSADVWAEPEIFDHKWSGGAPPEPLFTDDAFTHKWGQNWGIPLYRWPLMRGNQFAWWRQRVRLVREIFHLFRIDHVLGFYRIYAFPWRPQRNADFLPLSPAEARLHTGGELPRFHERDDETPENKAANRKQGEDFLRMLLEETGAWRLIGEDLGVVPDYVRPSLASLQIPGFKIPIWETERDGALTRGAAYPRLSVATHATHDHQPLRALWEGWMKVISDALSKPVELAQERDRAWREVRQLAAWAGFDVPRIMPFSDAVHERLLDALFQTNSWLAMTMITDLFATSQRFNVPGAVSESNWSQRLAATAGQWRADAALSAKMQRIRELLQRTGRLH